MKSYCAIGLMSGSSLDGLDIAACKFIEIDNQWSFEILHAECLPFEKKWIDILKTLPTENALSFHRTHTYFGHYLGKACKDFIDKYKINADLICSHGHTIFHNPTARFTTQIGDGAAIASQTGIQTVSDLRTVDVALGGQGAPIVPIGDLHLFPQYKYCLNLGGIANISMKQKDKMIAYDICGANQILNKLAQLKGFEYDAEGQMARNGKLNNALLTELNGLGFYKIEAPKSLSNQWVQNAIPTIVNKYRISNADKLNTYTEHIAIQIANCLKQSGSQITDKLLITGGGAFNKYLIERINLNCNTICVIPNENIVKFKEALVMALFGILRLREQVNILSSVTGAVRDCVSGAIYKSN